MHVRFSTESTGSWVAAPSADIGGAEQGAGPAAPPIGHAAPPAAQTTQPTGPTFEHVLRGFGRELDRGEALTERALSGHAPLSSGGLLLLQAGIYRYTEAVDLVTKVIDRGTQAVRTTLQNP